MPSLFKTVLLAALVGTALTGAATAEPIWTLDGLKNPAAVEPDLPAGILYVTEMAGDRQAKDGLGSISKVSPDGKLLQEGWVSGLNAPKGIGRVEGTLYVADIDELVAVEIETGKITQRYPAPGAVALHDVSTARDGRVFVSDTATNTIWLLEKGSFKPWLQSDVLNAPEGIAVDVDRLLVAGLGQMPKDGKPGAPTHLVEISFSDKQPHPLGDGTAVGFLDGLAIVGDGTYLSTDIVKGPLYRIYENGAVDRLMDFAPGAADLAYDFASKVAYVPLSTEGKLVAIQLE